MDTNILLILLLYIIFYFLFWMHPYYVGIMVHHFMFRRWGKAFSWLLLVLLSSFPIAFLIYLVFHYSQPAYEQIVILGFSVWGLLIQTWAWVIILFILYRGGAERWFVLVFPSLATVILLITGLYRIPYADPSEVSDFSKHAILALIMQVIFFAFTWFKYARGKVTTGWRIVAILAFSLSLLWFIVLVIILKILPPPI